MISNRCLGRIFYEPDRPGPAGRLGMSALPPGLNLNLILTYRRGSLTVSHYKQSHHI